MLFKLPLLRSPLDAKTTNKSSIWCIDSVGLHFMFVIFLHFFTLHSTLQQMDFVHLSALENRMGDLKDWPLQFGENNSTHFRTSCSTKNEKMWSFWGLFDPLPPSDQCWILWWWSNLCICQHLSFQHWLGGEGVGDHFFTFMWSDPSMMSSSFVAFLSVKTINFFLKFWIIFPKNVDFEGVSLWALPGRAQRLTPSVWGK